MSAGRSVGDAVAPSGENVAAPVAAGVPRFPPPALRVRTFRWYWIAQWPVLLGTWMQVVALGYFVYQVTGSQTAIGVVAAADGLPAVALSLAGGVIADRVARRRMLVVTQSVLGLSAGSLALLAFSGRASFGSIIAVAIVFGAADAMDLPTRQALIADLVDRDLLVSAVALGSVTMSATRIVGPLLAGVLIATVGPGACFATLSLAYVVPVAVLITVIPDIAPLPRQAGSTALGEIAEGLRLVVRDPLVRSVAVCVAALAFLGVSYMPYLPVLAKIQLHSGGLVLGLLYGTGGIGGLVAGLLVASLGTSAVRVRMLLVGGCVYAVSLFTLSHSHTLAAALPALVGISFGFLAMSTSMTTLLQTETDPRFRGRLLGVYTMMFAGLQPLGTLAYGLIGRAVPLFDAIGVGALAIGVVAVAVSLSSPLRSLERG